MAETTNNKETNKPEESGKDVTQKENINETQAANETADAQSEPVTEGQETEWKKSTSTPQTAAGNQVTAKPQAGVVKQGKILLGCGMFVLGVAIGIGGTLLVQNQPWKNIGSSVPKRSYDVDKCVKLGDYDGIKVSLAASDEDLQSEIDNLIDENTTYEQIKNRKVKDGDKIYAKFDGYVNNKLLEDASGEEYISIGEDEFVEGFDKAFIGAETGKEITFKISIPEGTYGDDSIDGKEVTFKATVQYICGNEIKPEWNDDFVQSISDFKTTDEYLADLKQQMEQENEEGKQDFAWTQVLEASKVTKYPDDLLEAARDEVLQGYYDMADMYGMSHDEIFQSWGRADEADFVKNDLEELAQDTVKETLVAEAIAKAEGINYSDDEYNEIVSDEYEYNSDSYDSKEDYEKDNREYLQGMALKTKVQEWISKRAKFSK